MKSIKLLCAFLVTLSLSGCFFVGQESGFSEHMQDNFLFTSASDVAPGQRKCIVVTKPYQLKSGYVTFSVPAGKYVGRKQHKTGVFYYAPSVIKSSNRMMYYSQIGIYLNNQSQSGNLFGYNPNGDRIRPVRSIVLPKDIFKVIRRPAKC